MRKSRFLSFVLALLLVPMVAVADSYTTLWKKYEAAIAKDHPRTALKVLDDISSKAKFEHAYGHLIKAQYATVNTLADISPDSLMPAVERLKEGEAEAVRTDNKVVAAIYQSVLGHLYTSMGNRIFDSASVLDNVTIGKDYYRKSMQNPDALAAAYATSYTPIVEDDVDSKYYYDDMLHVIGQRAGAYKQMHDYYAAHGKREAACLTALQLVKQARRYDDVSRVRKSKYIMSLDSLAREYGDLLVCGEVAIERYGYMENAEDVTAEEKMNYINYAIMKWGAWPRMNVLRNAQKRLTLPSFHVSLGGQMALPGVVRNVLVLGLNNLSELKITATRLDIDGTATLNPNIKKDYATLLRHVVPGEKTITDVRRYVGLPAYKTISDTLQLKGLRSGVYLIELSTDNASVPVERELLYVCNLYPVVEAMPGKCYRVAVLDATTGAPVQGAQLDVVMSVDKNGHDVVSHFVTDANGEVNVKYENTQPVAYRVYTDDEKAFPRTQMASAFRYFNSNMSASMASIYTDRSIYRPGQTVHVATIAYKQERANNKTEVAKGATFNLVLRDANAKEVMCKSVTTDDFGMASADFVLPQGRLYGTYTLTADYGNRTHANFSVEEYKRPTFRVDIEKSTDKYVAGDTVTLKATAQSFASVPVQGAKVTVKVVRRPAMFWRFAGNSDKQTVVFTDTLRTSQDGTFAVKVPINVPDSYEERPQRYYMFDVTANVTDAAGETRYAEASLPYSDRPTLLTCNVPAKVLRDSLRTIRFDYVNNAGQPIDGDVAYTIDSHRYTCKANTDVDIDVAALTSARHELMAVCGTDTITTSFLTFTLQDRKAPIDTHDWFYQSADVFPADGSPVYIQLGSSDSLQHVLYTIVSGDKVIDNGRADLTGELRTRAISYKEEWGDGVVLSVAWVKSGHSYIHTAHIARPLSDHNLRLKWTTFRDRLTPGQRETWTLNITNPDGTPAKAQLLATMYDKSLDDIRKHNISRPQLSDYIILPFISWRSIYNRPLFAYSDMPTRFFDEPRLRLSHINDYFLMAMNECLMFSSKANASRALGGSNLFSIADNKKYKEVKATDAIAPTFGDDGESIGAEAPMQPEDDVMANEDDKRDVSNVQLRENLQETAFFYPGLLADDKGNVSLQFTLPESVTTWQLYAMAHDQNMRAGILSGQSVAKKMVMVQPNVPRFVRPTDKGVLSALISNTSDKAVSGIAQLVFADPQTGKQLFVGRQKFSLKAGHTTTANFDFDMSKIKNDGLLVCRVTASGNGYSDGEQHYLPVLPNVQLVTNTTAFSQNEAGHLTFDVKNMFDVKDKSNKLTIEYTNSPSWLMIQALPTLATPDGDNAISLASAYYANALGRHIMNLSPDIKSTVELWKNESNQAQATTSMQSALQQNEELKLLVLSQTPWLADADRESEQKQQLINYFDASQLDYNMSNLLSRLARLQRNDGSFAWWSGMEGSPSMTMSVVQMLVRLNSMIGEQQATNSTLRDAFAYMDKQMAKEVSNMKKLESEAKVKNPMPSEMAIRYLYATTLAQRQLSGMVKKNVDYLVSHLVGKPNSYTIYGKSILAVVLAKNGYKAEANDVLESMRQYSVYNEEMGRYFDSPNAYYSWFDYRIPSQVAAIEALKTLQPNDKTTIAQMQRWLLQSKRTQMWSTPINTVDAIYAFLGSNADILSQGQNNPVVIKLNGQKCDMPKSTAALGYTKTSACGDNLKTLDIEKSSDGTSWGAIYAQFKQPLDDVTKASMGISVERQILKDGVVVSAPQLKLVVGDCITMRIIVKAQRDYDYVQVVDNRAACLEPLHQISGYGNGYYCQPKDYATCYYFDHLSKGVHVIETSYYVDRCGQYSTGTCEAQCAYAPEFMGRTKTIAIDVTNE